MKTKLPSKKEIKKAIQFGLLLGLTMSGAIANCEYIWSLFGLPVEWWSVMAYTALGVVSALELFRWIGRD